MVELSRELDKERERSKKLVKETHDLADDIKARDQ